MAFELEINRKWCKKCGLCVNYCPRKVYDADPFNAPIIAQPQHCVGCMQCEVRCPDFAISVERI